MDNKKELKVIEDYDELPDNIKEVLSEWDDSNELYQEAERMRTVLKAHGWDFDYDLSGNPTEFWEL